MSNVSDHPAIVISHAMMMGLCSAHLCLLSVLGEHGHGADVVIDQSLYHVDDLVAAIRHPDRTMTQSTQESAVAVSNNRS